MLADLDKKKILVTGASSGIGLAVSRLLDSLGATVVLTARNPDKLALAKQSLERSSHRIFPLDISEIGALKEKLKQLCKEEGPLDGVVHCAGMHSSKPLKILSETDISSVLATNVASSVALAQAFRQKACRASSASLVYLSSVVGHVGQSGVSLYSASKGAVISLTKSLALELARENIRVNCVVPGVVMTEMTSRLFDKLDQDQIDKIVAMHPMGLGEPSDVANSIAFLLSPLSKWITGTSLVVDGGYLAH